ncbi:hypothetical protein BT69DRAFT_998548 [Atractiella rhizophila]|nr:hypothetical protein BT69DRAFT_998548 [Atractiella rhizophila]
MVTDTPQYLLFTMSFEDLGTIADQPIALEDFGYMWGMFSKALSGIKKGRRFENSLWRLWYEEMSPSATPFMRARQPKTIKAVLETLIRLAQDDFVEDNVEAALEKLVEASPHLTLALGGARLASGRERDGCTGGLVFKPRPPVPHPLGKLQISLISASSTVISQPTLPTPTGASDDAVVERHDITQLGGLGSLKRRKTSSSAELKGAISPNLTGPPHFAQEVREPSHQYPRRKEAPPMTPSRAETVIGASPRFSTIPPNLRSPVAPKLHHGELTSLPLATPIR